MNFEPLVRPPHVWMVGGMWWCTVGPVIGNSDTPKGAYDACMHAYWSI